MLEAGPALQTAKERAVDFSFSDEQQALRVAVRRFLDDKSPESEVRRLMDPALCETGYDPAVWTLMADQLGLTGFLISEEFGGSGFSFADVCIVLEEMGRSLYCGPFLASAVASPLLLLASSDDAAKRDYLAGIALGTMLATPCLAESTGRFAAGAVTMTAVASGDTYVLSGEKHFVIDGSIADLFLVIAQTQSGLSLFAVERAGIGVAVSPHPTLDQTRRLCTVTFDRAPAQVIGVPGEAATYIDRWIDEVNVALCAEAVGGAQACLDMAVAYAKDRIQFAKPIGSFQAIKHKCADVLVAVESARSAAYYAAWAASVRSEEFPVVATLAKSYCSEAYFTAAAENIQIHGGIGFTWEHPAHLYFKRAKSTELLFGDSTINRELFAQRIGL